MTAYVVVSYDITDPDGYAAYGPAAGPSVAKYQGEVVIADRDATALEGGKPGNVVVLRFPSAEAAEEWYRSPEYQTALPHRLQNTANGRAVIATGFTPPA